MIRIGVLRLSSILGAVFGALDDRTMPLAGSCFSLALLD